MAVDAYLIGRRQLTQKEEFILGLIKQIKKPIIEPKLHAILKLIEPDENNSYKFGTKLWLDNDGNDFIGLGYLPYSDGLHGVINSLVDKYYLTRSHENPFVVSEDKQLRIF